MAATTTIKLQGNNAIDLQVRQTALQVLNNLPTDELQFLGQLAKSDKARKKLMSNKGTIKMLVGL